MFLDGEFEEAIDYAAFADTQEEPESVYAHLEWLRSLGGPPILIDTAGKLGDDLIHGRNSTGQRFASIPAFTSAKQGQPGGMLRHQCTAEYKINVVERVIRRQAIGLEYRQRMPKGVKAVQYFGLSYDGPGEGTNSLRLRLVILDDPDIDPTRTLRRRRPRAKEEFICRFNIARAEPEEVRDSEGLQQLIIRKREIDIPPGAYHKETPRHSRLDEIAINSSFPVRRHNI